MDKVSLVRCESYIFDEVKNALRNTFDNLGGVDKFIKPGMKVLLKLNLLMKKNPDEAVTTNPVFVEALIGILQEAGAIITIADSPGGPYTVGMLRGIYKACGIEEVAVRTGVLLNYDTGSSKISFVEGKISKSFDIINPVLEADMVITVPKLKTHGMAIFTGAVKNLFGVIPGVKKAEYHFRMEEKQDFCEMLVDLCELVKPGLAIMDGIVGMEGEGPSGGNPRKVGVVIASTNPYLVDLVAIKIISIKPSEVYTVSNSINRGLCESDFNNVNIIGEDINDLIIRDFKLPSGRSISFLEGLPKPIKDKINRILSPKPVFIYDKCIGCGDCALNCPPKAIDMKDKKPNLNLEQCIKCFCCQELCPRKAVEIKRHWLIKHLIK